MRILALFSTLVFLPFAAWAGQVQNSSLTLPYDTTQDLADVVKIFTDSYDAYRSVSIRVAFGPLIELGHSDTAGRTRLVTTRSHH
jgi:hypothetical protein